LSGVFAFKLASFDENRRVTIMAENSIDGNDSEAVWEGLRFPQEQEPEY